MNAAVGGAGRAYTTPASVYLALYTTNPTASDTGTEVSGGSYARVALNFAAAAGGQAATTADAQITGMPAATVAYLGIRDSATAGNLLFYGPLAVSKTTNAGDTFVVRAGDLTISLS